MVNELDSGLRGLGSRPGLDNRLRSWAGHFILTVPLIREHLIWSLTLLCVLRHHGESDFEKKNQSP